MYTMVGSTGWIVKCIVSVFVVYYFTPKCQCQQNAERKIEKGTVQEDETTRRYLILILLIVGDPCFACRNLVSMDAYSRASAGERSVLVVCREANQQDAHHAKWANDHSGRIHAKGCEVGIACVGQDSSEEPCPTEEQGWVQGPLSAAPEDH